MIQLCVLLLHHRLKDILNKKTLKPESLQTSQIHLTCSHGKGPNHTSVCAKEIQTHNQHLLEVTSLFLPDLHKHLSDCTSNL